MRTGNVLLYGREGELPRPVCLRAGPLSLSSEEGDLRYICLGEHEILRRVYVAIRDRNWQTIPPVLRNVRISAAKDSFTIAYDVENKQGDLDFCWHGAITGDAGGRITFLMDGIARSAFWRNRIGFCVLHPAACAGARAMVEHVDGSVEQASLPVFIAKEQPVLPFAEMRAMRHEAARGLWAEVRFTGDIFEMEDQRNWTDASFKTFCTPLRLPFPVEIRAGTRIRQSVTLTLPHEPSGKVRRHETALGRVQTPEAPSAVQVTLEAEGQELPLPAIGLAVASHGAPLSDREVSRLRALNLGHLRVDLHLAEPGYAGKLRLACRQAQALGVGLEVALFLSENADSEMRALLSALDERAPIARWLVYPARELFGGGSPTAQVASVARLHLAGLGRSAPLAAGTNSDFILLQRSPPPLDMVDLVTLAMNPQSHAFDNASLVETLEAQALVVENACRLAGSLPVMVSPVTMKPRLNPAATGPIAPAPPDQLPAQVDVRQMSLFGAVWTLGSIKYLAQGGAHSITYYETTGWRGVMETEGGSPLPDLFPSLPGSVFPLYHVLADVGAFRGGQVLPLRSNRPLAVDGMALRKDGKCCILLANMTAQPQAASLPALQRQVRLRHLNEGNAEYAMTKPEDFLAEAGAPACPCKVAFTVALQPYGIARITWGEQ